MTRADLSTTALTLLDALRASRPDIDEATLLAEAEAHSAEFDFTSLALAFEALVHERIATWHTGARLPSHGTMPDGTPFCYEN